MEGWENCIINLNKFMLKIFFYYFIIPIFKFIYPSLTIFTLKYVLMYFNSNDAITFTHLPELKKKEGSRPFENV